ncbi:cupin domain-containing protein [Microvirga yunnanensis]|uniref:cupin domain-containing protein n=1 Tax=Microvirga yunnanensis TaxID=2953740 RepID=UPI0021C954A1|nr:cupin domain-containing protein [Microvirga sp. HBU65207]
MPDATNIAETIDILGPQIRFLTPLADDPDEYCVISSVVPPNVVVPLHSHSERETLLILSGNLEAFDGSVWSTYRAGDVFDVPSWTKHAFRNASLKPVSVMLVTSVSMGRFFRYVGRQAADVPPSPPTAEAIEAFMTEAVRHGYWLGNPAENAEIGILL